MEHQNITAGDLRSTPNGLLRGFVLLLAACCGCVTAAAQTTEFVELASVNAAGTQAGNGPPTGSQSSEDGRFVLFVSEASDLIPNDTNGVLADIFVRDVQLDTTTLVSVNSAGTGSGNGHSRLASMTPDGRFVVFVSDASNLVPGDADDWMDVFVRDLVAQTTTLVSVNTAGIASGGGEVARPFITPDGRYAIFSSAADLVAGDGTQSHDVFRRDLLTGTTARVSVGIEGTHSFGDESFPAGITPDGRYVLFGSNAPNITANDTNHGIQDFFRRDFQTNTTALASSNRDGTASGSGAVLGAVMSDDGQVVAFESTSSDLVLSEDGVPRPSVYAHDFASNTTTLVSEPQVLHGTAATIPPAGSPRISADGRYVFYLRFENFVGGLNRVGFRDRIFRRDRQTGELLELPFVASGLCGQGFNCRSIVPGFVTSRDGRYVAYRQQEQPRANAAPYSTAIVIRDMVGGGTEVVVGLPGVPFNSSGTVPLILNPGSVVAGGKLAFTSGVGHSARDTNGLEDVYLFAPPAGTRLAFSHAGYSVSEDGFAGFPFGITVRRAGYVIDTPATVRFATSDGTAHAGSDYAARSETLTFATGESEKPLSVRPINDDVVEPDETLTLTLSDPTGNAALGGQSSATLTITDDDPHFFQFSASTYEVFESAGSILITVSVTGTPTETVSVDYSTSDGTASERSDYITAAGRLTFAPGETSRSFRVFVVDDVFVEGEETINLSLSNPIGAGTALGGRSTAELRIPFAELFPAGQNPVDSSSFFVRQHYLDFLNREPDPSGFRFWTNEIESCGADARCREVKRINVSAAFFLSIEFQETGFLAYLSNKAAFGSRPLFRQFERDVQELQKDYIFGEPGDAAVLEANKRAYFADFVTRPEFEHKYNGFDSTAFVRTLLAENGLSPAVNNLTVRQFGPTQNLPPGASNATGLVIIRRDPDGVNSNASVSVSFENLMGAPTAVHIHGPASFMVDGPVIFTLPAGEFTDHQITLTPEHINMLDLGHIYVDVHTEAFPDGEIRADLSFSRPRGEVLTDALRFNNITRAQAFRIVAESVELKRAEFKRAFVLMEYFGYLRRDPDREGYDFWLGKLDAFNGDYVRAEMVKAFLDSAEYRRRFGDGFAQQSSTSQGAP